MLSSHVILFQVLIVHQVHRRVELLLVDNLVLLQLNWLDYAAIPVHTEFLLTLN